MLGGKYLRVNAPRVVHEKVDDEIIAIDLASGTYYSMRDSAAAIWELLDAGCASDHIVVQLAAAHGVSLDAVRRATEPFLAELEAEALVTSPDAVPSPNNKSLEVSGDFQPPRLDKHTDMAEMILLDPVHEVDSLGWPHRPEEAPDTRQNQ